MIVYNDWSANQKLLMSKKTEAFIVNAPSENRGHIPALLSRV